MGVVDWPFLLWADKDDYKYYNKLEQLNMIHAKVHVIHDPTVCNASFGFINVCRIGIRLQECLI